VSDTPWCAAGFASVPLGARLELVGMRVKPKAKTEKEFINEVMPPPAASSIGPTFEDFHHLHV
jgi:hypothetical protein